MRRREVRKIFLENPEFANWIRADAQRLAQLRAQPQELPKLLSKWKESTVQRSAPTLDYAEISRRTKRASDVLGRVQTLMNTIIEYANEQQKNK